jgi:hypothetical protein
VPTRRAMLAFGGAALTAGHARHGAAQEASPVSDIPPLGPVPMFRGNPARTGVLPGPALRTTPTVRWRTVLDSDVDATPAVIGGVVYAVTGDTNLGKGTLYALDASTGAERWRFPAEAGDRAGSPASAGGVGYLGGAARVAVDA